MPPGPGGGEAHAEPAGVLGVAAGHEGRGLLVPHLDEADLVLARAQRLHDAVDAVARACPKTMSTPQSISVSTSTSAAVSAIRTAPLRSCRQSLNRPEPPQFRPPSGERPSAGWRPASARRDLARGVLDGGKRRVDDRVVVLAREEPGAALERAHAAAQQRGREGDVGRPVEAGEVAVVARRRVEAEADMEDAREAGHRRRDAGAVEARARCPPSAASRARSMVGVERRRQARRVATVAAMATGCAL